MGYPEAPWRMHGDLWLSLFRVTDDPDRRPGLVGVAWVHYRDPSPLTYHELLVARPRSVEPGGSDRGTVTISDIWVDSADSRDGGRDLWAIPKDLCDFTVESSHGGPLRRTSGPLRRTSWAASHGSTEIASATFTDVSSAAPRLPFRGGTRQERDTGEVVRARISGSARTLPARATWDFAPEGPLGWLAGRRALGSVAISGFEMSFG